MKLRRTCLLVLLAAGGLFAAGGRLLGEDPVAQRTQRIPLVRGWNAVFLEVYPLEAQPEAVFQGTPIDRVASHYARPGSAEFVTNPGADLHEKAGWGVWYAPDRSDAFLKSLHAIHGQQAYLVHATRDFIWEVAGSVVLPEIRWVPDAYNLVGFAVDAQAAPTFAQFFDGSKAHRGSPVYRLSQGSWRRVTDLTSETMRSGEAFWIYCSGASRYQGPLEVGLQMRQGLLLSKGPAAITLRNQTSHPVTPEIEHLPDQGGGVPLSFVVRAVGERSGELTSLSAPRPAGRWRLGLPALESGEAIQIPLEARPEEMSSPARASLLRVRTDLGTEVWVPVFAIREDLEAP